nr:MAG TPA: hypothetical protein [Caudoviricetes sp.]
MQDLNCPLRTVKKEYKEIKPILTYFSKRIKIVL